MKIFVKVIESTYSYKKLNTCLFKVIMRVASVIEFMADLFNEIDEKAETKRGRGANKEEIVGTVMAKLLGVYLSCCLNLNSKNQGLYRCYCQLYIMWYYNSSLFFIILPISYAQKHDRCQTQSSFQSQRLRKTRNLP